MQQSGTDFKKVLGNKEVLALAFGAMIGWGWIVLTGGWVTSAGSMGAIIAMALGSVAIIFIGLCYAELASTYPFEGGALIFSFKAMGHFPSFICTWALILGYFSVVAFEAVALPTVFDNLIPHYQHVFLYNIGGFDLYLTWVLIGMIGAVIVTFLNYFGIEQASVFQTIVTVIIVVIGAIFFVGALIMGHSSNLEPLFNHADNHHFFSPAIAGIFSVLIMVPFLFVGFDVIPQSASEINLPPVKIGKVLIISVVAAMLFYCGVTFAVGFVLKPSLINANLLTTPQAMQAVFGGHKIGFQLMILAGIAGIVTSWNAFFIGGSRAIYALAKAKMLPSFLAYIHPKHKTPTRAILLMGLATVIAPLLGRPALVWFVDAGSLAIVIAYLLVCISFVILRFKYPNVERPFRLKKGLVIGILGIIGSAILIVMYLPFSPAALIKQEWVIFAVWVLFGLFLYAVARVKFGTKESKVVIDKLIGDK
ncbi:amino acid permease [Helicobacter sp. 13S00401-1]|uniref:APC family permease n=1 Tax=Helicobacter sp. 13S00401-1 TaxID=1905758 RepID=UPI000BA6084E|nr:APC family permease [Helicobacter sp. 13S00401-1]PAF50402.1 amino acid permease [Helicobacter sp. 13S00401-1]